MYSPTIEDHLNGSTHLILDTLFIPPGAYLIEIIRKDGSKHILHFEKQQEDSNPSDGNDLPLNQVKGKTNTTVYRNTAGELLPAEDLIMKENTIKKTLGKILRKLEYKSYGKEGAVIYHEGERSILFYMELGGNNCVFFLRIPTEEEWESVASFSLSEREEILRFVAEGTLRDQASSCTYTITDHEIAFYRKT